MGRKEFKVEPSAIEKQEKAKELLAMCQPGHRSSNDGKWILPIMLGLIVLVVGCGIGGTVLGALLIPLIKDQNAVPLPDVKRMKGFGR